MSAKKWLTLLAGFFCGFGVIGLFIFADNRGGLMPAYVGLGIGIVLLMAAMVVKDR